MVTRTRNNRGNISPYEVLNQQMKAREFCQRWFKATEEDESKRGYRERCVILLARVLKVRENTIQRWGKGLEFENMPEQYEVTLAYADIIREMLEAVSTRTDMLNMVLEKLDDSQ
ncbi:MAG TPA: hypothetical protein V6D29_25400 [Leptolyngbyaceae cyanobacterium]